MSVSEELQELYKRKQNLEQKIEIERAERVRQGNFGHVQDVRISQERENRLKDELNEINEKIARFESRQDEGMIPLGGNQQKDFFNGIDDKEIIDGVMEGFGLDSNGSQNVEVTTTTQVRVTEDKGDGYQNIQEYTNETTEQIKFNKGSKVSHDKNAQIKFILKELKDGVELSSAVKQINVSIEDVNQWLEDGKNGKGVENIGFYNEVKQLETSTPSNEITIEAKKVEDTKKPETPRVQSDKSDSTSGSEERKLMSNVLKYLQKGDTYDEAAEKTGIPPNLIVKWRKNGLNKVSENTIYFYKEIGKIESFLSTKSEKINKKTSKKSKPNSKHEINSASKIDMRNIILFMKKGNDRKEACIKLNVDYDLFLEWYIDGSKNRNKETRNFWRQIQKIESENKPPRSKNTKPKNKPKVNYDYSNKVNKKKSEINNNLKPQVNPVRSIRKPESKKPINSDIERVIMFMKKGFNRMQASRKANVDIGQISTWYKQGSKNYDEETKYFYEEVKKIESK